MPISIATITTITITAIISVTSILLQTQMTKNSSQPSHLMCPALHSCPSLRLIPLLLFSPTVHWLLSPPNFLSLHMTLLPRLIHRLNFLCLSPRQTSTLVMFCFLFLELSSRNNKYNQATNFLRIFDWLHCSSLGRWLIRFQLHWNQLLHQLHEHHLFPLPLLPLPLPLLLLLLLHLRQNKKIR